MDISHIFASFLPLHPFVKKSVQPIMPSPTVFLIPSLRVIRIVFLFFAILSLQKFFVGMVKHRTARGCEEHIQKGRGVMVRAAFITVLMMGLFFLTGIFLP